MTSIDSPRYSIWTIGVSFFCALVMFALYYWWKCNSAEVDPSTQTESSQDRTNAVSAVILQEIASDSGLKFQHQTGAMGSYFFPEIMGSGAAFLDFDCDGDLDVYVINAGYHRLQGRPPPARLPKNHLFEQVKPGSFVDVTERAGVGDTGYGMGVAAGDLNNDGYPDIYVTNFGPDRVFLNQRNGTFREVSKDAGIASNSWGTSVSFVDFDGDGRLDIYVANYVDFRPLRCTQLSGVGLDYCSPHLFPPTPDRLFRNVTTKETPSKLQFVDVSVSSGIAGRQGPGLGVVCADFTGDGQVDIYVANDQATNFLWVNKGQGRFREEASERGVAVGVDGQPQASMGIALGDPDHNHRLDILLTHLQGEMNALYLQSNSQGFDERAAASGLGIPSLPMTGFGAAFVDVNHNGLQDLFVVNGRVKRDSGDQAAHHDSQSKAFVSSKFWDVYRERNQIFLGGRDRKFREVPANGNHFLSAPRVSRALVVGDIDNDGDLDFLVTNTGESLQLYRNDTPKTGHWLLIRVVDPTKNGRYVLGAVLQVEAKSAKFTAIVNPCQGYLSCHDPRVHIGLGNANAVSSIRVRWPDGSHEQFTISGVDRIVTVAKGKGAPDDHAD